MASISTYLQKILDAVYGEEVRSSIHDALAAMNEESSNAMEYAVTAKDSAAASASSARDSAETAAQKANEAIFSAEGVLEAKIAALDAASRAEESEANAANSERIATKNASDAEAAKAVAENAQNFAALSASDAAVSAALAQKYSGKPPKPQDGTWWIWNAETGQYEDTQIGCELIGPSGVSIEDIQLTSGDHTPGTTDIYTVTLTDGTTYNISVYNGRNGTGAGDVLGIEFDLVLPASGWSNGCLTVSDSRLAAMSKYKYFLSADEASQEEFIDCGVQAKDITTDGFLIFTNQEAPTLDLTVHVVRFELGANGA